MCTPGDDSLLIVGTVLGSLHLYDLKEFERGVERVGMELDYEALLNAVAPDA
jgi:hypothetical protein